MFFVINLNLSFGKTYSCSTFDEQIRPSVIVVKSTRTNISEVVANIDQSK